METPFQRIDNALAQHYKNCGRNDYFDQNEDSKFIRFVKNNALDENAINLELRDVNDPNNCPYIKMDPLFPLASSTTQHQMTNELQNNEILNILKHCYTCGIPPSLNTIHRLLGLSRPQSHDNVFVLHWKHIANALRHELYNRIASSFMEIVNGNTRFENVNGLLRFIKLNNNIDQDEVNYIQQLIERAKAFHGENCVRAPHIDSVTNRVSGPSTPHDTATVIHMDDILTAIHDSDDKTTMHHVLSHLNEEEYDTDALIDDLHDDVARYLNKAQPISQSDTSPEIRLKYYNYDEWMRNTKQIVNDIWASHWTSNSPHSTSNLLQIDIKLLHSHENIDSQCGGLNVELLHDIYNVHKCFLLGNYHFTHYDVSQFSKDIQNCKYLKPNIKKYIESVAIESSITTTTIDLYPSYVIEDDMYATCQYFFCASRIVHQETQNNDDFSLRMCVIPNHVICIYDDDIIIPFGIDDIASYLESIHMHPIKVNVSHSKNTAELTALLEYQMNTIKVKRGITNNVLCIVEKRPYDHDVLYIILTNSDSTDLLWELNLNYVIALEFNVLSTIECHLRYGRGRIRFYPEHLITIMPRFFKRNCKIDYAQEMEKLYEDSYKHGFAVDLNDSIFNKYYKIITKFQHISVNYNRNFIKPTRNLLIQACTGQIKECAFIKYIIHCLNLFKEMTWDPMVLGDSIDVNHLNKSYTHIIDTHSFSDRNKRTEIKMYVSRMVGTCTNGEQCLCIKEHNKQKDEKESTKKNRNIDTSKDVLIPRLHSLHCCLLHGGQSIDGIDSGRDGMDVMDETCDHELDEMDEFIKFVLRQYHTLKYNHWIEEFVEWLNANCYNWDSVLSDLECCGTNNAFITKQSNIYSFLKKQKQSKLFPILNAKYVPKPTVGALNFGETVLRWFEYGFKSQYQSLSDEASHN
eukprot:69743_1